MSGHIVSALACFAASLAFLLPAQARPEQKAPPAFSMDQTTFRFAPGQQQGRDYFELTLTGMPEGPPCDLRLTPLDLPNPPAVSVDLVKGAPQVRSESIVWPTTLDVRQVPVTAVPVIRRFIASCGGHEETLKYSVDNSGGDFSWKVKPIKDQRWDAERPLSLQVAVGSRGATNVRLLSSQLVEPEGLRPIDGSFILCRNVGRCDGTPLALAANLTHELLIYPRMNKRPTPGSYSTSFTLLADEKSEGEELTANLLVSHDGLRFLGAVLIVVGVLLSLFVTRVMRQRSDRIAMLRPAAILKQQFEALRSSRAEYKANLRDIDRAFLQIESALDISTLKPFLPRTLDFLPPPANVPAVGGTYQEHLNKIANELGTLSVLINGGVLVAAREPTHAAPERALVERTIGELDQFATQSLTPAEIAAVVRQKLVEMRAALARGRNEDVTEDAAARPVNVGYSTERLAFQSTVLNFAGWLIFALLTSLLGIYLLVLRDNDFGQMQDLVLCLLWGLGLPSAGQGLASLGSGSIASAFGVNVVRA